MSFSKHVVPRTDAKMDMVGDRKHLILVGMAAVWFALLIFTVQRLVVALQTGLLTPWWGNAAGLVAMTALWAWYRRRPQTRSSGAAHGTALIATITLLIPVAYGLTSTVWWLSLVGFAAVLLGRRQEAKVWGVTIPLVMVASVIAEPYVQIQGVAGELPLEAALAKIVFVVILIGMAVGFRRVAEQRALVLHDSEADSAVELQKNRNLLNQAEKMGRVGGWEIDIETGQLTWTETVYDIHELDFTKRPTVDQGVNFYTPESRPIIERAVQRAIEQGEPFDVELEIITAKGNLRSVHAIGQTDPVRRKVSGFFQDITERKRAEVELGASEAKFRALFEWMGAGIQLCEMVFDEDGRPVDNIIFDVNPAYEKNTGIAREQVVGKRIKEILPIVEQAWLDRYGKLVRTREPVHFEEYSAALDRWFDVHASPMNGNRFVVIFSDITERKQAEQALLQSRKAALNMMTDAVAARDRSEQLTKELKEHREHLEQLVEERTGELEVSNRELEAFSYSVSHDLRAPLRSVDGFARMLEQDYAERLDDEGRRLLQVIRDSTRDMGQLINDLLAFSRLSRKELKRGRIGMSELVEDVRRQVEQAETGRAIRWDLGKFPPAFGDEAMIQVVLINLLANAVKFTRPRPDAAIGISGRVEGNDVVYAVTDNGVGFDMAYKDKLFGVFQRLHATDEFEGTGIGLALVKRIVQRHNGRVWAEGKVNEGATFYFTLPCHKNEEDEKRPAETEEETT